MELTIVIRHYYSFLGFIYVSISHKRNYIYCYGFDFDRIRFLKIQCLIQFYVILIEIKIKYQYYVCCIFHLLEFEYALFFILSSLKVRVLFSKENGAFLPFFPLSIYFS